MGQTGDLITLQRARLAFPNYTDTTQDSTIELLVTAASKAIERYCRRRFTVNSYDELYDTDGTGSLILNNFPVLKITRLAMQPTTVLTITNSNTTTNSRCTVATTLATAAEWPAASTGLVLTRIANGVSNIDASPTWASYPTVQLLANFINTIGLNWTASVQAPWGIWPSSDINPIQGAIPAFTGGAQLSIHTTEMQNWNVIPDTGQILFTNPNNVLFGTGWLPYPTGTTDLLPGLNVPRGLQNMRIQYQAGFNTVPDDVQQACALFVAHMFAQPTSAGGLTSETLGDYSYTREVHFGLPKHVKTLVSPYRDFRC